jgi:hypothetical protein
MFCPTLKTVLHLHPDDAIHDDDEADYQEILHVMSLFFSSLIPA